MFICINESTHSLVSDFGSYLQHSDNRRQLSSALREGGYNTFDSQAEGEAGENGPTRPAAEAAGWTPPHQELALGLGLEGRC